MRIAAAHHRSLASVYAADHSGDAGNELWRATQRRHCEKLGTLYEGLASEYDQLAREHQQAAER